MQIVLEGTIDSFKPMGDIIQYEGTLLKQGTWRGIDGNEIHYEDLNVLEESAPSFSGSQLVHGHRDKSRKSVRGFNSVAWFDGEAVRNRGYIFDPPTVKLINAGKYPIGQSMEASVFVDTNMRAMKIVGRRVAIGIEKTAVSGAIRAQVKNVRLEKMGENKFVDAFKEKLTAVMADEEKEEKAEAIMELFTELMEFPDAGGEAESKYVLLTDKKFAEMKAAALAKPDPKAGNEEIKDLQTRLAAFEEAGRVTQLNRLEGEIKKLDAEFSAEVYLKDIEDHVMKVRMLTSYLGAWQKIAPILPVKKLTDVKLQDGDLDKYSLEVFGSKFEDLVGDITGVVPSA